MCKGSTQCIVCVCDDCRWQNGPNVVPLDCDVCFLLNLFSDEGAPFQDLTYCLMLLMYARGYGARGRSCSANLIWTP